MNKTVIKDEITILTGLIEASTYDIAVKASTVVGFGNLGTTIDITTLEDSE